MTKGEKLSNKLFPKTPKQKERTKKVPYASAIGSLMYTMLCTRSDISYAAGVVRRYQSNPGETHWKAAKRILRYLKSTMDYKLCYQG